MVRSHFLSAAAIMWATLCFPAFADSPASQLKVFSKDKNPHYYLAQKYREERKYEQARSEFSILLESNPNDVQYRIQRGQVEIHLKDYRGALLDADSVLQLSQTPYMRVLASEIRAKAFAELNKKSEAIPVYTAALKSRPTEPARNSH